MVDRTKRKVGAEGEMKWRKKLGRLADALREGNE
jgi:hypothetical protein